MRKIRLSVLAGALVFFFLAGASDDYTKSTRAKSGQIAPDFKCQTLTGQKFSLSAETGKGKVVLINFFATWCGPCLNELPHLQKAVFERFGQNENFSLIAIGREHTKEDLSHFQKKTQLTFPIAPDPKREIYGLFADKYIPRNVLIGSDGKILRTSVGFNEEEFAQLVAAIGKALQ